MLGFFKDENTHHIRIPRAKLALLYLILFALESAVLLAWHGIFIILSVFLCIPLVYMVVFSFKIWQRYYAPLWYILLLLIMSGGAWMLWRVLI